MNTVIIFLAIHIVVLSLQPLLTDRAVVTQEYPKCFWDFSTCSHGAIGILR